MENTTTIEEYFKNKTFGLRTDNEELAFTYDVSSFETKICYFDVSDIDYSDMFEKNETKIEFDKDVSEIDKWDYITSVASGTLTGVLSTIFDKKLDLENAHKWGEEKVKNLMTRVARAEGFTGSNVKVHMEKNHKMASDTKTKELGGSKTHHLNDFSHHFSTIGLVSSIFTQFTGYCIGSNESGTIVLKKLTDTTEIGGDIFEKLFNGTYGWIMHLLSDADGSSQAINGGTGITGPILSHLKLLSTAPIFKSKVGKENDFATILKRAFWGKDLSDKNKLTTKFDLRTELGIAKHIMKNSWTVIINELLVRIFYAIRRLAFEAQEKGSFEDIEWRRVLPFNNRTLTRMLTVSSGIFVAISTTGAAIKAAKQSGGNGYAFLAAFVLNLNFAGIGRFAVALAFDARYLFDDAKTGILAFTESYGIKEPSPLVEIDKLYLSANQYKLLYSLKKQKTLYDIEKSKRKKQEKNEWLKCWENEIENGDAFELIDNKSELYNALQTEISQNSSKEWLHLVAIELMFFSPYHKLGIEKDEEFKGLKSKANYEEEIFANEQEIVTNEFFKQSLNLYKQYVGILDEQLKKKIIALAVASAILLPGDITGLALLGAAPIVAGGYSLKNSTELILGGGALFGVAGARVPAFSSRGMVLNECAKILIFSSVVLKESWDDILKIIQSLNDTKAQAKTKLETLENERVKDSYKKQNIKELKATIKYIDNCTTELKKLQETK